MNNWVDKVIFWSSDEFINETFFHRRNSSAASDISDMKDSAVNSRHSEDASSPPVSVDLFYGQVSWNTNPTQKQKLISPYFSTSLKREMILLPAWMSAHAHSQTLSRSNMRSFGNTWSDYTRSWMTKKSMSSTLNLSIKRTKKPRKKRIDPNFTMNIKHNKKVAVGCLVFWYLVELLYRTSD